jgi:hypothetical protein
MPLFSEIEAQVEEAIREHLMLDPMTEEEESLVKRIDNTMLVLEMRDLTLHSYENFINELTYTQFLFDDDFKINNKPFDTDLSAILNELFDNLMEEIYKYE